MFPLKVIQEYFVVLLSFCKGKLFDSLYGGKVEAHVFLEKCRLGLTIFIFVGNATGMDDFGDFFSFVNFSF